MVYLPTFGWFCSGKCWCAYSSTMEHLGDVPPWCFRRLHSCAAPRWWFTWSDPSRHRLSRHKGWSVRKKADAAFASTWEQTWKKPIYHPNGDQNYRPEGPKSFKSFYVTMFSINHPILHLKYNFDLYPIYHQYTPNVTIYTIHGPYMGTQTYNDHPWQSKWCSSDGEPLFLASLNPVRHSTKHDVWISFIIMKRGQNTHLLGMTMTALSDDNLHCFQRCMNHLWFTVSNIQRMALPWNFRTGKYRKYLSFVCFMLRFITQSNKSMIYVFMYILILCIYIYNTYIYNTYIYIIHIYIYNTYIYI